MANDNMIRSNWGYHIPVKFLLQNIQENFAVYNVIWQSNIESMIIGHVIEEDRPAKEEFK